MDSNFRIQFINGMLKGHDLTLPLGEFSLGEGADVWVKFQTQPQMLSHLSISERGISLKEMTHLWINGIPGEYWQKQMGPLKEFLPLDTPLDLDGVGFVLLPNGEKLSEPKIFELPERKSLEELQKNSHRSRHSYSNWKDWIVGAILALSIACLSLGGWKIYQMTYPPIQEDLTATTVQWLQEKQQSETFSSLSFLVQPNGEIVVSGACWESKDLNRLYSELRARGWLVRSSVVCNDELTKGVEYTLRLFGFDNAVITNGPSLGSVHISGAIKGDGNWQQVEDLLIKMPGLKNWTVSNEAQEQAARLMQLLSEQNFSNPLDFAQKNSKILVTGRLNEHEQAQLQSLFEDVQQQFPNNEFIYQNIEAVSPDLNIWPTPIVAIGGNQKTPFVELSNGLRLQVGSKLPSGYQIISIDSKLGIRLMMQGKVINVPIDFNI